MQKTLKDFLNGGGTFDIDNFSNPPSALFPTYSWLWTGKITKPEIKRQLDKMCDVGIKSFYVLPLPEDFSPGGMATTLCPDYLSDEYFDLVRYTSDYAKEKGMSMWLYDEGGWPSGNACEQVVKLHPELAAKKMAKTENGYELQIRYYPYTLEQKPHYADSASQKANDVFIDLTYKAYKKALGDSFGNFLPLMFTDEPAIRYPAWPDGAEKLYKERYGEDMKAALPAIFSNDDDKENARLRIQYCTIVSEIFKTNYFEKIHNWCIDNNILFSGHLNMDNTLKGSHMNHYGSQVDTLRTFDIPGIDVIWRQIYPFSDGSTTTDEFDSVPVYPFFVRLAPSAANLNGTNLSVSECFAIYGHGITADLIRYVSNYQFVRGINIINVMTIPFESEGTLPFTMAPLFFEQRPDYQNLTLINTYLARMSYLATLGKRDANTALVLPLEDVYAMGEREQNALESFKNTGAFLEQNQVDFDIIDSNAISQATVKDGVLLIGNAKYKSVIIPDGVYLADELKQKLSSVSCKIRPVIDCDCKYIRAMRRLLCDGRYLYFIFNESNKSVSTELNLKNVSELDCVTGKVYPFCNKPVTLQSGQMLVLVTDTVAIPKKEYTREYPLTNFKTRIISKMILSKNGVSKTTVCDGFELDSDFSGEVSFTTKLSLDKTSDALLSFETLYYSAKVLVNGKNAGFVALSPYTLEIPQSLFKTGDNKIEIIVANTPANAYLAFDPSQYFEKRFLGTYNQKQRTFEKDTKMLPGFTNAKISLGE